MNDVREILKTLQTKTVLGEQNRAMSYMNLIDEAEQALMEWVNEVIGEDVRLTKEHAETELRHNQLRAIQRKRAGLKWSAHIEK